jgi:uncharacterized membrane protein YdbT with pleckstrin-like domain
MSYVQSVLQPGETIRHTASIHPIVYWPAALMFGLALVSVTCGLLLEQSWLSWLAACVGVIGFALTFQEWFTWWTTEIVVTNLRVIYKTGFIRRKTNEMNIDKVESVRVDQTILGRLFDYGDVSIIGTGEGGIGRHVPRLNQSNEGQDELRRVAKPLALRNSITASDRPHAQTAA